jgi:hypothetical protein
MRQHLNMHRVYRAVGHPGNGKSLVIATIKAALWGAASLAGLYLLALSFRSVDIGWMLCALLSALPEYIRHSTGWNSAPASFSSAAAFEAGVNAVLGALIFSVCAVIYQFLKYAGPDSDERA